MPAVGLRSGSRKTSLAHSLLAGPAGVGGATTARPVARLVARPVAPRGAPGAVAPVVVVVGVRPKAPVEATVQAPSAKE